MNLQLQGKIAMVAASSKGLGYGIAYELAKEGANLSIGRELKLKLKKLQRKIEIETSVSVLPTILDSSKAESIEKWTKKTLEHYGGVDLLVVNAGGSTTRKI